MVKTMIQRKIDKYLADFYAKHHNALKNVMETPNYEIKQAVVFVLPHLYAHVPEKRKDRFGNV